MKQLKMLIIHNSNSRVGIDGISKVIYNYYSAMDKKDFIIDFVFIYAPYSELKDEIKKTGGSIFILERKIKNIYTYTKELKKIIKEGNYNIVYAHGNSRTLSIELYAAKSSGVKARIAHVHTNECKYKTLHYILKPFFNRLYTQGFACSGLAGKCLFGKRPFIVLNNSFDVNAFKFDGQLRKKYREEFNIGGKTVIGHVGFLDYGKNHKFLIKTFAEYNKINPDAILFLIGIGSLQQTIYDMVASLKLQDSVIFAGQKANVNELLNIFDCFVFPSLAEGFGIAMMEAQANGLTVIASENRIPKEVSVNNNFFFLPLEEGERKWAEKIAAVSFKRCPEAVDNLTKAGFHIKTEAGKLEELLKKMAL